MLRPVVVILNARRNPARLSTNEIPRNAMLQLALWRDILLLLVEYIQQYFLNIVRVTLKELAVGAVGDSL